MASVYTHTETFTQRRFYTQRKAFTHSKLLHTKSFTHSKLLQKTVFTQRSFLVHNHNRNCSSKTGWISTPKRQKDDFAALLKRTFKRTIATAKIEKICWQITVAALMHPLQYYLRDPAAKDNSIAHAAPAPSNLDAAITMRSAETELQNTIELRATASAIAAPKLDLDATATKRRFCSTFWKELLKGKLLPPKKLRKSADKSLSQPSCSHSNTIYEKQLQETIVWRMQAQCQATLTQPLQCDLQRLSCKTQKNYAQQRRKLQLQNQISTPNRKKDDFEALFKRIFKRKINSAKIAKMYWQITVAAFMQPQYDLRSPAAKDNSIAHAAPAPSNLDAATTMRSAETKFENTIELRASASAIAAPQPDLDSKLKKRRFWSIFYNYF